MEDHGPVLHRREAAKRDARALWKMLTGLGHAPDSNGLGASTDERQGRAPVRQNPPQVVWVCVDHDVKVTTWTCSYGGIIKSLRSDDD